MKDPTRLAAIKALKPTPGPLRVEPSFNGDCNTYEVCSDSAVIFETPSDSDKDRSNAEFFMESADPEYGLQALAAEVERLQEREKPVMVSFTQPLLSSFCPFPCGVPLYPKWKHCPNCGRRLEWK